MKDTTKHQPCYGRYENTVGILQSSFSSKARKNKSNIIRSYQAHNEVNDAVDSASPVLQLQEVIRRGQEDAKSNTEIYRCNIYTESENSLQHSTRTTSERLPLDKPASSSPATAAFSAALSESKFEGQVPIENKLLYENK